MAERGANGAPHPSARTWVRSTVALSVASLVGAALLAPLPGASPGRALTGILFVGSSVHVASTACLFSVPDVRAHAATRRMRYLWVPCLSVVGAAVLGALTSEWQRAWLLLAYFTWQFWHYQKQNLGVAALAASAIGTGPLTRLERAALTASASAGIVALAARPSLLQLDLGRGDGILFFAAQAAFAAAVGCGVVALGRRRRSERPADFCAAYLTALFFSVPIFVFRSPYAAIAGMTIAHGMQYLGLVALTTEGPHGARWARRVALVNVAVVGGAVLSVASHLHDSVAAGRALYGAYAGMVMAHFVVDAGLWRLRDPACRALVSARLPFLVRPGPTVPTLRAAPVGHGVAVVSGSRERAAGGSRSLTGLWI